MIMPAAIIVLLLLAGTLTVFAQSTPTLPVVRMASTPTVLAKQAGLMAPKATPRSTQGNKPTTAKSTPVAKSIPSQSGTTLLQLPAGWTAAGLDTSDALDAQDTAGSIFTAREERFDFRDIGSRALHGGSLTGAFFILSSNAKARFLHNDIRVINNTLFDRLLKQKEEQRPRNIEAHLMTLQEQGQQQFALVDVSFFLLQSTVDNNGQRTEGYDPDPATGQPRLHHMTVLLLRIPPADQGPDAPAGGYGWLVSNYGLDLPSDNALQIVQPA
jgi:hypothetical protein